MNFEATERALKLIDKTVHEALKSLADLQQQVIISGKEKADLLQQLNGLNENQKRFIEISEKARKYDELTAQLKSALNPQ